MKRRTFLKSAVLTSLAGAMPWVLRRGAAQEATYGGPYWLFVSANGGWDPRFMFDPTENPEQNRIYTGIGQIGAIRYAPIGLDYERLQWDPADEIEPHVRTAEQFLSAHGHRLTVVNGIDTTTNNHDGGQRAMGSGRLALGYPALAAIIAAAKARTMPMAFFSGGGYDVTGGHIPLTRVSNAGAFTRLARPNVIDPNNPESALYHTPETMERIARFSRERSQALLERQRLPALRTSMQELIDARASTGVLERIELPAEPIDLASRELNDLEAFMRQGQLVLSAFKSGLSATGSLSLGGFDTHGNHDRDQTRKVLKLLGGIDFLIREAEAAGLGDRLYIVVTSEFARGPHYNGENAGAGKDHWPITSMFALGPTIPGDRVIGATDDAQLARKLDPQTLQPADDGIKLGPEHVHHALRAHAAIEDHEIAALYPLPGQPLPLFG